MVHKSMGVRPWWFPFPLTIINTIVVYVIATLLLEVSDTLAARWVASVVYWVLFLFDVIVIVRFGIHFLNTRPGFREGLFGLFDGLISLHLSVAGVFTSIVALSSDPLLSFENLPIDVRGYDLYFSYALPNTIGVFNTAGLVNVRPVSAVASLWFIVCSDLGVLYLVIFVAIVLRYVRKNQSDKPPRRHTVAHQFPISTARQRKNRAPKAGGRAINVDV